MSPEQATGEKRHHRAQRHLFARQRALRDAHRQPAAHRRLGAADHHEDRDRGCRRRSRRSGSRCRPTSRPRWPSRSRSSRPIGSRALAAFADALKNPAFTTVRTSSVGALNRSTRWKTALALGLLVGAAGGALAARVLWRPAPGPAEDRIREQLTFNGRSTRPAISPAGDFVAFVETACEHGQYGDCRSSLLAQRRSQCAGAGACARRSGARHRRAGVMMARCSLQRKLTATVVGLFAVSRLTRAASFISPSRHTTTRIPRRTACCWCRSAAFRKTSPSSSASPAGDHRQHPAARRLGAGCRLIHRRTAY